MTQYTPKEVERAIAFYEGSPDGQYDELAAVALRAYAATLRQQAVGVDEEAVTRMWDMLKRDGGDSQKLMREALEDFVSRAALAQHGQQGEEGAAGYFTADPAEGDFTLHDTLEAAVADAEKILGFERDMAAEDGWKDEPPQICYGVVLGKCVEKEGSSRPAPEGSEFTALVDYRLTRPAARARVPEGMVLVPAEAVDTDAFMVLHVYKQPGRTRKDAYRIAIRNLAERASEMLAAAPSAESDADGEVGNG